ncbi:MAG: hypothetical protein WCD69_05500, partial [Xanthobacteraceae bacterium]
HCERQRTKQTKVRMGKVTAKPKLNPAEYATRFAAEKALLQRRYCEAFALWKTCGRKRCRRSATCRGKPHACLAAALDRVPQRAQWLARQDILAATPPNIGKPERAARHCMPGDLYQARKAP